MVVERLTADGFKGAAGYSCNEEAAQALVRALGGMVVKCNVGNFAYGKRAAEAV